MKTNQKIKLVALLFAMSFAFVSCNNDDDTQVIPASNTIVDLAVGNENLSILVDALTRADGDLVAVLDGNTNYTVLAPTNQAFETFLEDNKFNSLSDVPTDVLSQVLLNHVIPATVPSSTLVNAGSGYTNTSATGAGNNPISIYFDTSNGVRFNNVASVSIPDVVASNGIVHVVDAVIGLPSVVDHALSNPNFSNLVAALGAADGDLVNELSAAGPFTILAPDNTAFSNYLDGTPLGDVPTDALASILLNHVIGGSLSSTNLVDLGSGYTSTSATVSDHNLSLYFDTSDGVVFNGISKVTQADVVGTNGIIHAVDAVIDLPTIATFATSNPALSILVEALAYADTGSPTVPYIDTVSDANAGPFTVFAPTNTAFANLLVELDVDALTDLETGTVDTVLLYHIVNANVKSTGLPNGTVATLGGNITANNTEFTLTDANNRTSNIVTSLVDIQGVNGVVHVIDKVILFPL